jgi:MoaA/NifB/PqqE/SkfB family radical SAM enzyme
MAPDLSRYTASHRAELQRLLATPAWQEPLAAGLVAQTASERLKPAPTRGFTDTVVEQLLALNGARAAQRVAEGCRDEGALFQTLSRWPTNLGEHAYKLSFLGLNVTPRCNIDPRCQYCNQPWVEGALPLAEWKRVVDEVSAANGDTGAYIYITGGEPLLLGADLWGDDGLVPYATLRGNSANVNTNGTLITPEVALRLIKGGLGRLHISLDSHDPAVQNTFYCGDWYDRILEGIYNVQLARDLVGVDYPRMHLNCVLTRRNLDAFPDLFAFVLEKHAQIADKADPLFTDLFPHTIPVGGDENAALRPTADEFVRFYEQVWPRVTALWREYQVRIGVPEKDRGDLPGYFVNPYLRVQHKGSLENYAQVSAEGRFAALALPDHCYVAPTQATFSPDGQQYRCGWHAIARWLPLGNIQERGALAAIRYGLESASSLPSAQHCEGCSLATLYINQQVEARLREKVAALFAAAPPAALPASDPQ